MKHNYKRLEIALLAILLSISSIRCSNNKPKDTITTEENKEEKLLKKLEEKGIELEPLGFDTNYYRITKSDSKVIKEIFDVKIPKFDTITTPNDFAEILEENNISYDNVLDALNANKYLQSHTKDAIARFAPKEKDTYDYNGILLKYNLAHLKVIDVFEKEKYYSMFDPVNCCIYINCEYASDLLTYTNALLMAVYGYTTTSASIKIDDKRIYCSTNDYCVDLENKRIFELGKTFETEEYIKYFNRGFEDVVNDEFIENLYMSEKAKAYSIVVTGGLGNGYRGILEYLNKTKHADIVQHLIKLDSSININDKVLTICEMEKEFINYLNQLGSTQKTIVTCCKDIINTKPKYESKNSIILEICNVQLEEIIHTYINGEKEYSIEKR